MADSSNKNQPPPPYPYQQPAQWQQSNDYAPYPHFTQEQLKQQRQGDQRWGTQVMGAPANPSTHPDNQHVATGQYTAPLKTGSGPVDGNLSSKGSESLASISPSASGVPGQVPQSPYVQQDATPGSSSAGKTGTGTIDQFRKQATEYGKKAEVVMNNIKGHLMTGKFTDTAWGRMTAGTQLLTKGGFEGVFKATFPVDTDEKLKKTYACFLSTSTGPVAGTLYISTKKFAFCSDRPLSNTPVEGQQQAFSYYKVIIPLHRVKEVIPSVNEQKPAEKYIQIATKDNFEFWFMGFVNYDKGVLNTQLAVATFNGQTGQNQQPPSAPGQQPYPPNQPQQPGLQSYPSGQQPYPPNHSGHHSHSPHHSGHHSHSPNHPPQGPIDPNTYGTRK